jgi:predicted choloylglycine hydrolase
MFPKTPFPEEVTEPLLPISMPNWSALKTLPKTVPEIISVRGKPIFRLRVQGNDYEIGLQRGHALAADMRRHWPWMRHLIEHVLEVPSARWDRMALTLEKYLAHRFPWMLAQIEGMAKGSGVPAANLILANFYALVGSPNGNWCTSVAVRETEAGPLLGQNLDIGAEDVYYAEERHSLGGHPTLGHLGLNLCRSECGVNSAGLAVASSNLPALARQDEPWNWDGMFFHFLPTLVLRECGSVSQALEYLRSLPPTIPSDGGYQLNLLDATGDMAVVDCVGSRCVVRQCSPSLNFTSNCTTDEEYEFWRLGESHRVLNQDGLDRVGRIRDEWKTLDGGTPTRAWLANLLATNKGKGCLCRWSEKGNSRLSFIFSPVKKTMDISNGPPNITPYERLEFKLS